MEEIICIDISNFTNALPRGRTYEVLAKDIEKRQIRIKGDNERVRWYPQYCFSSDREHLWTLKSIIMEDDVTSASCDTTDVTLVLNQGNDEIRRWCYFLTTAYVYRVFSRNATEPLLIGRHGIFLPMLSEDAIRKAIDYLLDHNQLEGCTLPLDEASSEE